MAGPTPWTGPANLPAPPSGSLGYQVTGPNSYQTLYPGALTSGYTTADALAQGFQAGTFEPTSGYNPANYPGPGASGQSGAQAPLQTYANLYSQAQAAVANYGQTEQAQLANTYAQQQATQAQGLQARGLGNTTVANSVQTGISQAQQLAQTNLGEQVGQYQTDVINTAGQSMAGAQLGVYQQQTSLNAQMQQEVAQINAAAALQQQQIAAQAQQQASQFSYATALAAQQYGYNSNLQAQQIGLQSQYQQQLLQLQNAISLTHPAGGTFQPSYGPGLH